MTIARQLEEAADGEAHGQPSNDQVVAEPRSIVETLTESAEVLRLLNKMSRLS